MTASDTSARACMNLEVKEKWLEALRSGRYRPGQGYMRVDGCYCPLGVLCDLYRIEVGGTWVLPVLVPGAQPVMYFSCGEDRALYELPDVVREWAGLSDSDPRIYAGVRLVGLADRISRLNDDGMSFVEIADRIEREL